MRRIANRNLPESLGELLAKELAPVVVIVDCQNDFAAPEGHFAKAGVDVAGIRGRLPKIAEFLAGARSAGIPVIHVHQLTLPNGASDSDAWLHFKTRTGRAPNYTLPGSWGAKPLSGFEPVGEEPVVFKYRPDAFLRTNMEHVLAALRCRTIVVCGMFTEGCVESTVRSASHRDYYVVVAEDAVASVRLDRHEASLALMRERYTVSSSLEILDAFLVTRQ